MYVHWLVDPYVVGKVIPTEVIRENRVIVCDMKGPILHHAMSLVYWIAAVRLTSKSKPAKLEEPGLY